ncbi:MAG: ATP-binding protein [Gammaproteobacteria bacterium]
MLDTKQELIEKIRLGEDSLFELKSVRFRENKMVEPARNELADELAAFANTAGGVLLVGVDDKSRDVEGIPIERLDIVEAVLREVCNDSLKPPLTAQIVRMTLPDASGAERAVIRVEVSRSLFVHKSPGGYFERIGSSKRELSPEKLARLFQQRSQAGIIRFDEQGVPDTTPDTLVRALWGRFTGGLQDEPPVILGKLKLITKDEGGAWRSTVGGILMCTEHPEQRLPGAIIEAVHYRSSQPDSNYQEDARTITGPLDEQIRDSLAFVCRNMRVGATKVPGRVEIPQYSLRAVFEAVVNAVAHRDYSIHGSKIRLFMFSDRLELYSPGALANTLTVDSLPLRQATRNELIASLLAKCPVNGDLEVGRGRLMDKRGEGVPIILEESRKLSGRLPVYRLIDDSELRLTIYGASLGAPDA